MIHPVSACHKAALEYLQLGWSVLPLCAPNHQGASEQHKQTCHRMGKTPVIPWKSLQEKLPKESMVNLWWTKNPERNVGIALGPVSGLVGLDIDTGVGADLLLNWAQGQVIPPTLEFKTPSGFRLLFAWPKGSSIPIQSFRDAQNKEILRVLAKGSQTVLPPSQLAKGGYEWQKGHGPKDIPPAPLPEWLLSRLAKDNQGVVEVNSSSCAPFSPKSDEDAYKRAVAYLAKCDPCVSGQGGHNQLMKVCCYLIHGFHLEPSLALPLVVHEYNPRCQPPWSLKEIQHKIAEASIKGSAPDMGPSKGMTAKWGKPNPPRFPAREVSATNKE